MIVVTVMDVYLVPVGGERYELYCEVPDEPEEPAAEPPTGFFRRMKHRFTTMLAEAERERRHGHPEPEHVGMARRVKARSMRWVAESIAEQRLLWHLRRQDARVPVLSRRHRRAARRRPTCAVSWGATSTSTGSG